MRTLEVCGETAHDGVGVSAPRVVVMLKKLAILGGLLVASFAQAQTFTFSAQMDPSQEVDQPVISRAFAEGKLVVIKNGENYRYKFAFRIRKFVGEITAFHIHAGLRGVNGPIVVNLMPQAYLMKTTGTSVKIFGKGALNVQGSFTVEQLITALNNNGAYFNIHTVAYPRGEIRGQISVTVEG
jgi:hypothetical protein